MLRSLLRKEYCFKIDSETELLKTQNAKPDFVQGQGEYSLNNKHIGPLYGILFLWKSCSLQ